MTLPVPETLQRITADLEARLMDIGYERGVLIHLSVGRPTLLTRIKQAPDSDWENPNVFKDNVQDLLAWAERQLALQNIPRRPAPGTTDHALYGPTWASLAYEVAGDPELRALVTRIRQAFWGTEGPPFDAKTLGIVTAREQAGAWLEQTSQQDATTGQIAGWTGLNLVLHSDHQDIDAYERLRSILFPPDQDGTWRGATMTLHELGEQLTNLPGAEEIHVGHRVVRPCAEDGSNDVHLSLRGRSGWLQPWPVRPGGQLHALGKAVKELVKESRIWTDSEALEYVMVGTVPSLSPRIEWKDLGRPGAALTLTFRAPATKQDVVKAYTDAMYARGYHQVVVKARPLSLRHHAVLQAVHELPNGTWKERLERYESWRTQHPELPAYRGPATQQAMRRDHERAKERANWQKPNVTSTE